MHLCEQGVEYFAVHVGCPLAEVIHVLESIDVVHAVKAPQTPGLGDDERPQLIIPCCVVVDPYGNYQGYAIHVRFFSLDVE